MTEVDQRYKRGMIYTIRNIKDDTLIYVGSTINTLSKRFDAHKRCCKNGKNNISLYNYIENNDWYDWYIELYEMYSCSNKRELERREGEVIREIGTVNKNVAGRSPKQYREDNADKLKERDKKYYEQNVDKVKEYQKEYREQNADKVKEYQKEYREQNADKKKEQNKEYREQNADKIKEYYKQNADKIKEYKKEWYEENADKLKESNKKYRENNKEKISQRKTEKICCDICGALISRHNKANHQRTKTCLAIKNSNNIYKPSDSHIADL